MPTQRISLDLSTETIRYLDHCKARGQFESRSAVVELILEDALERWEEWKDADTDRRNTEEVLASRVA